MAREKVIAGEVERITLRLSVDDYDVIKRMARLMPGAASPSSLIRQVVELTVPQWKRMLDGLEAMQAGDTDRGYNSILAAAELARAMGNTMVADIELHRPGCEGEVPTDG